ncbi:unnamed protein product [Aphis gossypii]|uniref:Uncharacterized protein n=1 Tax=Aphis gossypii TaxID=80765 RepID=A0A9P0J048_APHGO|nr:unnamed protein product [Aphis gossypii]
MIIIRYYFFHICLYNLVFTSCLLNYCIYWCKKCFVVSGLSNRVDFCLFSNGNKHIKSRPMLARYKLKYLHFLSRYALNYV